MGQLLSDLLGKIILLQSTLHVMNDEESMAKFVCRGFANILSTDALGMYLQGRYYFENEDPGINEDECRLLFNQLSHDLSHHLTHETILHNFEEKNATTCLLISTGLALYGLFFIKPTKNDIFLGIRPYIENTLNLMALMIENNVQKELLLNSQLELEKKVNERTRELTITNQALVDEIIERKRMEEELKKQEAMYHDLVETSQDLIWQCDAQGRYTYLNPTWEKVFGYALNDMLGKKFSDFQTREQAEKDLKTFTSLMKGASIIGYETIHLSRTGEAIHLVFNAKSVTNYHGQIIGTRGTAYDFTARKTAEIERKILQEQLIQAQKMESVGRLAGGVAHDFNNMIMVILGNAEMALEDLDPSQATYDNIQEILKSAQRSANLTRQLLAFARKQTIKPKVMDLNDLVTGMLRMLQRLIGENIDLVWKPGKNLWPIHMDHTQIDQILANLSVNARDAINGVGQLVIKTENVHMDTVKRMVYPDIIPGDYVLLAISDSGCGIDKDSLPHLFEPFYTTKELGQGTGLGLATVYGIIKQNNGFIQVFSKPGHGTTFDIYLPRAHRDHIAETTDYNEKAAGGNETILLVEDEPAILLLGKTILERKGYKVITARNPQEALLLKETKEKSIDLLITDVIMPQMNGRDLHEQLKIIHPDIRTIYMSGYTADVIAHHGILDEGIHFLEKPFNASTLTRKTRDILDANPS